MTIRAAILNQNNEVINIVLLNSLSELPNSLDGDGASIGDTWDGDKFIKPTVPVDLPAMKIAKNLQINQWRAEANTTTFPHNGKLIACDALSRSDIDGVANHITLFGTFPAGFPGAWKTVDNSYIMLPTTEAFKDMYSSMTTQGTANFTHAQALKSALATATTAAQVEAIIW